jgi:riboflavin kinase/FMN adenylyltransferase
MIDFIRPEQKFESFDALKGQILTDAETARGILASRAS